MSQYDNVPFAALRIIDALEPREQRVLVEVDGQVVAQLPAAGAEYKMDVRGVGVMSVHVHAHDVDALGGER